MISYFNNKSYTADTHTSASDLIHQQLDGFDPLPGDELNNVQACRLSSQKGGKSGYQSDNGRNVPIS